MKITFSENPSSSDGDYKLIIDEDAFDMNRSSTTKSKEPIMEAPCNCSTYKCYNKITEEKRRLIFDYYWKSCDEIEKRKFILESVEQVKTDKVTIRGTMKRNFTKSYSFTVAGETIKVCKQMFINTLGLSRSRIRDWVKWGDEGLERLIFRHRKRMMKK